MPVGASSSFGPEDDVSLDELGWNQLAFGIAQRCLALLKRTPRIRCRFGTLTVPGIRVTATEGTGHRRHQNEKTMTLSL